MASKDKPTQPTQSASSPFNNEPEQNVPGVGATDPMFGHQESANMEATASESNELGEKEDSSVTIVGIGASAGGLDAFEAFFRAMPPDSGMAFVLIQHMSPKHESTLAKIMQQYTKMPVISVYKPVEVAANHVYVTPPNRNISVWHNRLQPMEVVRTQGLHLPIDFFFRELARDQKERSICIVMSGTGSDGSEGLQAVHAAGGMVMVQDPKTAAYPGMPESAIATNLIDYVLTIEQMPAQLMEYSQHELGKAAQEIDQNVSTPMEQLQQIFILIRAKTGYDFSFYKQNTIGRRIKRRMMIHQLVDLQDYVLYLQQMPDEVQLLFQELLIGVTSFFRDEEAFAVLEKQVIPSLFHKGEEGANSPSSVEYEQPIRIWVPGCATGEEAYSIAILIQEYLDRHRHRAKVQIFATDIDSQAIAKARTGKYPKGIALDVTPERLSMFFNYEDDSYVITKQVREMIVFAEQSVIKDPPFSRLDMISCRNLMIYWSTALQKMVLPIFHYALNPGGSLLLGTSETVGELTDLFEPVNVKWKLYTAKRHSSKTAIPLELQAPVVPVSNRQTPTQQPLVASEQRLEFRAIAETMLFPTYLPSSVIANAQGEVLHFFGRTGKYLEPASGDSSFNLYEMARPGLRPSLATGIRKVNNHGDAVTFADVQVKTNGDFQSIRLTIQPIDDELSEHTGLLLIIFEDAPPLPTIDDTSEVAPTAESSKLTQLERELNDTKEFLQTTIEELETANEELRSTNEELQSANEELQSTNEELETSKEELQSLNEELVTVNSEYNIKIELLSETNNDLTNLMSSTNIATIFLDTDLQIKRFTEAATDVIHLINSDIGRPLAHIVSRMAQTSLVDEAARVLRTLIPEETEVETEGGKFYLMRVTPYRTSDNTIQGVVMTFVDLTEQKSKQLELRAAEDRFQALAFDSKDTIYVYDFNEQKVIFTNNDEFLGYDLEELTKINSLLDAAHVDDVAHIKTQWARLIDKPVESVNQYRVKRKNGGWEWIQIRITPISRSDSNLPVQVLVALSITTERRSQEHLKLERRQFIEQIADAVPVLVYIFDISESRIIYANNQFPNVVGMEQDDGLALSPDDMMLRIHADDRESAAKQRENLMSDESGAMYEVEVRVESKPGEWRLIHAHSTVISRAADGTPTQWLSIVEAKLLEK